MILSPYFWIAVLLAAISIFSTGYHNGYKHANDHSESLKLQAVVKAQKQAIEQAKADQKTAQEYESAREVVRTVYVKIKERANENIQNNNYDNCSLDADGLRIYNAHPNAAENPAPVTDIRVPEPTRRPKREIIDHPIEQHRALSALLRLPGTSQSIVRVGAILEPGIGAHSNGK